MIQSYKQTTYIHTYMPAVDSQSNRSGIQQRLKNPILYNIYIYRETIPYIYICRCLTLTGILYLFHFLATTLSGQVLQPGGKKNKSLMERWPGSSYGMYRGETLAFWPNALLDCVLLH